jgi:tetratricopeptide (TPR) repeat protein
VKGRDRPVRLFQLAAPGLEAPGPPAAPPGRGAADGAQAAGSAVAPGTPAPGPATGPARARVPEAETLAVTGDAPAVLAALATGGPSAPAVPVPHELPADVGAFTGRAVELAELDFLLPIGEPEPAAAPGPVVISAVSGTAGVGKTALAIRWAHRVAGQFPDGQLYVNLRGYDPGQPVTPSQALAGFLRALGVADADIPLEEADRAARYRSLLSGRQVLVLLDNAATTGQVRPLLPGSGSAMVVVTSRDSLAGLVAVDGARRLDLDLLSPSEAVALLTALIGPRAGADPAAAQALAGLCARLPLVLRVAAELAAARPEAPLADLVAELAGEGDRLELLEAGGDPHSAVASVFSWSYRHLQPDAARMFRLLGLHPAQHWDLYAAAALTATASLTQARRQLAVLTQAHLIQPVGAARYQMHDLLRAYAASKAASHDNDQARQTALTGLFDYYLAACAAAMDCLHPAGHDLRPDPPQTLTPVPEFDDPAAARGWLDAELPTLVSAAAHTASNGWPGHTIGLATTLFRYFWGGYFSEGLAIGAHALAAAREHGDRAAEARALTTLGGVYYYQGDFQRFADCQRECLALARGIGDRLLEARALTNLAAADYQQGRYQQAADGVRQALALWRELGDRYGETIALLNLGLVRFRQGRYQQAARQLQEALKLARQTEDRHSEAELLTTLGAVYHRQGRYQQAADHQRQAIALSEEIGDRPMLAYALTRLGEVCHRRGEHDQATEHHQRALALHQQIGHTENEAEALNAAGATLLATGQPGQAHSCHTTALTLTRQNGNRYQQGWALIGLAEVSRHQGQHDQAADYDQQALALLRDIGDRGGQAEALNGAGETFLTTGQPGQAHASHAEALTLTRRSGDRYQQARAHRGLAGVYHAAGQQDQAQQHRQHALDIYTDLGVPEATHLRTNPAPVGADHFSVTPGSA